MRIRLYCCVFVEPSVLRDWRIVAAMADWRCCFFDGTPELGHAVRGPQGTAGRGESENGMVCARLYFQAPFLIIFGHKYVHTFCTPPDADARKVVRWTLTTRCLEIAHEDTGGLCLDLML